MALQEWKLSHQNSQRKMVDSTHGSPLCNSTIAASVKPHHVRTIVVLVNK